MTDLVTNRGADGALPDDESAQQDVATESEGATDEVLADAADDESIEDAADDESTDDSRVDDSPVDDSIADDALFEDAPAEDIPDEDSAPAEDSIAEDSIAEDALVEEAPNVEDSTAEEPVAEDAAAAATIALAPETTATDTTTYAWAPAEPKTRKSRKTLWIGLAAGAAVVGLVASSLVLIAPGTAVAGVSVGWLTPGSAAEALQQRLADTTLVLVGDGGDVEVTAADLGATIDARDLADAAFAERPMWNPTQWFTEPIEADIEMDPVAATAALRAATPDLYADPVDATLAFDAATATYVTTPAEAGEGIDVTTVLAALQDAFDSGEARVELEPAIAPVEPTTTTAIAEETAAGLNALLDNTGFYIGDERTVPIDRAVAASWLTVTRETDGTFDVTADQDAIQAVVDTLPAAIDRPVVNATVITDSSGKVLSAVTAGTAGRALDDTSNVASDFAAQLAGGNGVYQLPVTVQEFTTTALARRIEVDLGEQRAYLFENDNVVQSWYISSGTSGHDTNMGHFRINAKLASQNMGNPDLTQAPNYYTKNVPNVMYFNGDQALHGAYWHNNFGRRMSHGCVNMPLDAARFVYDWAPIGTEVWVHA